MLSDPNPTPDLSLATVRRVHQICERFEATWRRGEKPWIEQEIEGWTGPDRAFLLFELIILEYESRRRLGETPRPADYLGQFPDDLKTIEQALLLCGEDINATSPSIPNSNLADDPEATLPIEPQDRESPRLDQCLHFGDDYVLMEEVGRGGQGVVYRTYQVSLKRVVALKTMISGRFASEAERERFRLEAERAANLVHTNIVPIHAVGEHDGQVFFTMDLVDGGTLAQESRSLRVNPQAAARVVATVARAIHFAHGKGFVHCDLKPANILLNAAGRPHVTDFGLSRTMPLEGAEVPREVFGTPSYMAPEQASGRADEITPATDVYGLGAILYEVLTGRPPFRASSMMETVVQVLEREPEPPRSVNKDASKQLEWICLKCLEKSPRDRFHSAGDVADALDGFLRGDDVSSTSPWQRLRRWTRREPELVSRLGGLSIMAALTEYNYRSVTDHPSDSVHYQVQIIFLAWALISSLFQQLLRKGRWAELARLAWAATDVAALTRVLFLLQGFGTELVVGYPLLIAASGLWFRVRLVWLTTGLAMGGYGLLYLLWRFHGDRSLTEPYVNIFMAALLVTGFAVARQVKRIWALSNYYENMPGCD